MIYTLTLNTAIDMNVRVEKYLPDVVNRSKSISYSANGKGINVSLVMQHFNVKSKIIGVFGGFTGKYIVDELDKMGYCVLPVWVDEPTRINVFTTVKEVGEYKLVSPGPYVNQQQQNEIKKLLSVCTDMETLVISGSLPPGIDPSFYDEMIDIVQKTHNAEIILDISHQKLADLLKYKPALIKPNDDELRDIFNLSVSDPKHILHAMSSLHQAGAKSVLLTLGKKGLYYSEGDGVYYTNAPDINLVSSACAGDACLAAFISGKAHHLDIHTILKRSSATGANVAASEGIGMLDKINDYVKVLNVIKLQV